MFTTNKNRGVTVTVMALWDNTVIGKFTYLECPRIGELVLLADNDGSGDIVWRVTQVVHFHSPPQIIIYVMDSTKEVELVKSYRAFDEEKLIKK